jgi:CxxC motif-containing protein
LCRLKSKHEFTCINCPLSCSLELVEEDGEVLEVTGAECGIGERYAAGEFKDPRRVVTTTVRVSGGKLALLPVRTTAAIPKRLVLDAVRALDGVEVVAPVAEGQLIVRDILETGVDVVSSRKLDREE